MKRLSTQMVSGDIKRCDIKLNLNHSSAEPPSYDSLFGRIRDTHKASRNVIDFVVKVRTLWRNFPKPTFNQSLLQEKTTVLEKIDLVSSDRSSYSDVVLLEVQLFQIFSLVL